MQPLQFRVPLSSPRLSGRFGITPDRLIQIFEKKDNLKIRIYQHKICIILITTIHRNHSLGKLQKMASKRIWQENQAAICMKICFPVSDNCNRHTRERPVKHLYPIQLNILQQ